MKVFIMFLSVIILIIFLANVAKWLPICDVEASWGRGLIQSCNCVGVKLTVYNTLPLDGERHAVCLGFRN
jgi:hypothetical protein